MSELEYRNRPEDVSDVVMAEDLDLDEPIVSGDGGEILNEEATDTGSKINAQMKVDHGSTIEKAYNAGTIFQNKYEETYNFSESGLQLKKMLSHKYFQLISLAVLAEETSSLIVDQSVFDRCLDTLKTHRILLISGDPMLGKSSMALCLAQALVQQHEVNLPTQLEVRKKKMLEAYFRSNLGEICRDERLVKDQILIFSDPFTNANSDLSKGNDLDYNAVLKSQISQLREANGYLILVADQETLNSNWRQVRFMELMQPPSRQLLEHFLSQVSRQYSNISLSDQEKSLLLTRLDTIPKMVGFSGRFFAKLDKKSLTLDDALARYLHKDHRFLQDIKEHSAPAWRLCLAVLLLTNYKADFVPSLRAHALAETLRVYFNTLNSTQCETQSMPYLASDKELMNLVRLEHHISSNSAELLLRFSEPGLNEQLWQSLMANGHCLLAVLKPMLEDAVSDTENEFMYVAAAALGRIGGLSPMELVYPLMTKEARRKPQQAYKSLAALFIGISQHGDDDYLHACLRQLKDKCQNKEHIMTYMLVLRELGLVRPELALTLIFESSQRIIGGVLNDIQPLWLAINQQVNLAQKRGNDSGLRTGSNKVNRRMKEVLFREIVNSKLFNDFQKEVFFASAFALAGLSFGLGTINLANKTLAVLDRNDKIALPLLALYWLTYVFEKVSEYPIKADITGLGRPIKTERTVLELIESPVNSTNFAYFLHRLDSSLQAYPPVIADDLRATQIEHIKAWVMSGIKTERGERALTDLLLQLSSRPKSLLWGAVLNMLATDFDFQVAGTPLSNFAIEIITRQGQAPKAVANQSR